MNNINKRVKLTITWMTILFLLISGSYQSAAAAMIGTEKLLQAGDNQTARDFLCRLMVREEVKRALIDRGINPLEVQLRLQSLTDSEVQLIAGKIDDLAAGGGVEIFSLIIIAVIIATVIIFRFTNITDVFP
jgi:hypothetical protein